jgi:beta-lactamase regulating signal transducer with metallopeptidase domain
VSTHLLLEAAVRTLGMGAIVFIALRVLRIDQVRARRTAWLLALLGALAMPALVAAQIGPRLLPEFNVGAPQGVIASAPALGDTAAPIRVGPRAPFRIESDSEPRATFINSVWSLAVIGYCVVAAMLVLRLCAGLGFAVRLRNHAQRVPVAFDPNLDVRSSARVTSPVTIASCVLLPKNFITWDAAILRVVLSHERAHVRQADFYVHALAALHSALFWFNPFSWWLQRQLSELGEALSDRAAVEQAESRASYAEILLAFAARTPWPLTGVAMANSSNLTPRIERLLSDRGFERSFAGKPRLPYLAAGVVLLAMVAATSMVRVQAAQPVRISAPSDTVAAPSAPTAPTTPAAVPPSTPVTPLTPAAPVHKHSMPLHTVHSLSIKDDEDGGSDIEEGVLAIRTDHSHISFDSGERLPLQHGDYIYFQHKGKTYLTQDPAIIEKAQTLLGPMQELRDKQNLLGAQQRVLSAKHHVIMEQVRMAKIDSPEFQHDMAQLQDTIKQMKLDEMTANIDKHAIAEVQSHLAEIQAATGKLQQELSMQMSKLAEQQGAFGEQQGKLGEQQAELAEQQRKIVEEVRRQLKPIVEQAIRDGKAQALQHSQE